MVAWERIAEKKIREAIAEGKFDGLSRPEAIDLEDYFKLPVELRLAYSVLKSAGCVPEEVALLHDLDVLERNLTRATDPEAQARIRATLASTRLKLDLALERRRRQT